jgi:hypothetical protein
MDGRVGRGGVVEERLQLRVEPQEVDAVVGHRRIVCRLDVTDRNEAASVAETDRDPGATGDGGIRSRANECGIHPHLCDACLLQRSPEMHLRQVRLPRDGVHDRLAVTEPTSVSSLRVFERPRGAGGVIKAVEHTLPIAWLPRSVTAIKQRCAY